MTGIVDDDLRAMLTVPVSATLQGARSEIVVWIDTAFNGGLVLPRGHIEALGLEMESSAEAILADGSLIELETFACCVDWFGASYRTQIVANDGEYPLLGTQLLAGRTLEIDYRSKTVRLTYGETRS